MKIKTVLSSTPVIAFIGFWIFASILYGDVFYMAEQYSLFAFDPQMMDFILNQPGGKYTGSDACSCFRIMSPGPAACLCRSC